MTTKKGFFVRTALTLTLGGACQSPASRDGVDVPRQPASQIEPGPAPEAQLEPIEPQPDKPLINRVYDLATRFGNGLTTEGIEASLDVHLIGAGPVFSGTSKRWPIVVSFVPAKADEDASLGLLTSSCPRWPCSLAVRSP